MALTVSHVREAPPDLGKPKIRYKMITAERGEMRDSVACCIMHMERSVISRNKRGVERITTLITNGCFKGRRGQTCS